MFERFTPAARTIVVHAQEHARRLGHRYVAPEHILLATVSSAEPAGVVLRECGLGPDRVEEEIVGRVGLGAGAGLFGDLDRDALASIGVDLDAVRARIEASFGADALVRAGQALHAAGRPSRLNPRRAVPPRLLRGWRGRRVLVAQPAQREPAKATGRYQAAGACSGGHVPFTPRAKKVLEHALREALALHDSHVGVEHVALALAAMHGGLVPVIMAACGDPATLRPAILARYRKAS
jgi:hypothetical protein